MKKKNKKLFIALFSVILFAALITTTVIAATLLTSTKGEVGLNSTTVSVTSSYSSTDSDYAWTYAKAGDSEDINVTVTNNTDMNIHRYYKIEVTSNLDNGLASGILVYYNDEFKGTLLELENNLSDYDLSDPYALLATGKSATDKISLELHQSMDSGYFDGKSVGIKVTTYTENFDYSDYAIIKTADDFDKIMTDIESGLLTKNPIIYLANSITITKAYTIKDSITIHTNGYSITGSLTLNDDETENPDALLEVLGSGSLNVTLGANYDVTGAVNLVSSYAQSKLLDGIHAGSTPESIDIIGPYSFYGISVAREGYTTYSAPTLTASTTMNYTKTETLTFTKGTASSTISYRHIGIKSDFDEENVLLHMPSDDEIITNDLFLPTYVPSSNASITWTSSDPTLISEDGKIVQDVNDNREVTLIATIRVNDKVYTRHYTFKVTSNNNKVNFQKLIKDISPLIIKKKYSSSDAANTTYYLPIVTEYDGSSFGSYDYRTAYTSPASDETIDWEAHEDIGLSSLTYAKYYDGTEESPVDTYDYIDVSSNAVMLSKDTLSNYAKILITGTFSNGEVYTSTINISISLGSDTELLEKAFNNVDNVLTNISVLGNILSTRISSGMLAEKGDFTLPATYGDSYTISYEVADTSGIIATDGALYTVDGASVYKFTVDPTLLNSVETSIPIKATVTYHKTGSADVTKAKLIYVSTPAAIHIADCGNISIFNSLKYQIVNTLPSSETENGTGFSVNGSYVTYSGYDYILLRDIVGDVSYLSDYASGSLYLTMNSYAADGSDGAEGIETVKLYNLESNDSTITDTLAYDFVKLIQWATGDSKVLASSVLSASGQTKLSSTQLGYKSNGEDYLTESELEVVKAFYQACTNATDAEWEAVKAQTLETAPGRIYDNATLLETVLNCLTSEKGVSSSSGWYENNGTVTYGTIYAKYLEVVNRYAITTSENEEPMSPAQEVYNSKFYYSFTSSAANSTASTATTAVSFNCKYYDASGTLVEGYCNRYSETNWKGLGSGNRQGTYAASSTKGDASVDLYANTSGYPYDSDHTKYITSAELMVLKAFWLGAISYKTASASANVTATFGTDSITKLQAALAADENGILPYPDYDIDDFTTYGEAILNAFDACLVTPTYFTSNGISALINSFYSEFNSTGYTLKGYGTDEATTFVSVLTNGVPAVTNLDNLEGVLSYFTELTTLNIYGNSGLSIFLSDYGLSAAFARITIVNSDITSLSMEYVSPDWNEFDLTNIKHLTKLTTIDVSNNLGIKTVNPLLNINRGTYTSVSFANIGEVYEYNQFVIENLGTQCSVTYSDASGASTTAQSLESSVLVNLSGIEDLVTEHLYLTNVIYNDDGTVTNVAWRVEEGNEMEGTEINSGGELVKFETVNAMNMRISPYYYCEEQVTFDGYTFLKDHLYQLIYENNVISVTDLSGSDYTVTLIDSADDVESTTLNDETGTEVNIVTDDEYDRSSTATSKTGNIYTQTFKSTDSNVTYTINMYYQVFSFTAYNEMSYVKADESTLSAGSHSFYLMANGTEVKAANMDTVDSSCYMVLLTAKQGEFVDYLNNNANEISSAEMSSEFGITADSDNIVELGIQNLSATISSYYIYSVSEKKFLNSGGFDTVLGDVFTLTKSGSIWYIHDDTASKYLDGFKQLIYDNSVGSNVISAVFNTNSYTSDNLSDTTKEHKKMYNSSWTLTTNNQSATATIGGASYSYSATVNTPTITVTTQEGRKYTVTFKCYTIRNARQVSGITSTNSNTGTTGSNGYVYDNGATLLLSINSSQPTDKAYYFCLLTETDIATLNAWYANPSSNIEIGESVSRATNSTYEYYIYNPFTRRYATGTFVDKTGSAFYTTSVKPNYAFRMAYQTSTDGGTGVGYCVELYGPSSYSKASGITASNFAANQPLYTRSSSSGSYIYTIARSYTSGTTYYTGSGKTYYTKSWNAYGGISDSCYGIAAWTIDSGSLWVFDDVLTENQYVYSYQEPSVTSSSIAYSLNYTVNQVTAHIVKSEITRYYEFDKYYYLDEDVTIDGNVYKKGNVIRFEYNAYYGKSYQAYILYYEVVFTYTKADGTTETITNPNDLSFIYYISSGNGASGSISYSLWSNPEDATDTTFQGYKTGFTITIGGSDTTVNYYDSSNDQIQWIYTEDSFNEVKYKLYDDVYGKTQASEYNEGSVYYTPTYQTATIFQDTFNNRKSNGTLYKDANGTALTSETYDATTAFYEIGNVEIENSTATGGIASTITKPGSYVDDSNNTVTSNYSFRLYDYYKFGVYDSSGNRLPLNTTYGNVTCYFKHTDTNGNVTYTTATPQVYDSASSKYISLTLDADTFKYFLNELKYKDDDGNLITVEDSDDYNGDYQYYIEAFVVSDFRQELLDQYNSVLYIDSTGTAVGTDATFNTARTYYTNVFEVATGLNQTTFDTYKSVLYSDAYGTALASDAVYSSSMVYYKKHLDVSNPEPSGNVDPAWTVESEITRLYSHTKNTSDVDDSTSNSSLETYKEDYEHVSKIWYQYTGADGETENIYSCPTVVYVYEPMLNGLVTEANWSTYKDSIYTKSGSNYNSCSSLSWSDNFKSITFYRHVLDTTSNMTTVGSTYLHNYGYKLGTSATNIFGIENANILVWTNPTSGVTNSGGTMDSILEEANSHFKDADYNLYYGKHYAYNGFTMESGLTDTYTQVVEAHDTEYTNIYQKGYVYRIVVNSSNTGFMWERVYTYSRQGGADMVTAASTGTANVGDTIWTTSDCFGGFYTASKFYRVVEDDFTKTLNVIQFDDITLTNCAGYTDISNAKIAYISQGNYLGYAGTFEIVISAVVYTIDGDGNYIYSDAVRTYKIKLTGAVIM